MLEVKNQKIMGKPEDGISILQMSETDRDDRISVPTNRKKGGYGLVIGGIVAIIMLHFAFQFSLIQTENLRFMQNLTKAERFDEREGLAERKIENTIPVETTAAEPEDEQSDVLAEPQINAETVSKEPEDKPQKRRSLRNRQMPLRSLQKPPSPQNFIRKKDPPAETRAERLRRAEKILTGA